MEAPAHWYTTFFLLFGNNVESLRRIMRVLNNQLCHPDSHLIADAQYNLWPEEAAFVNNIIRRINGDGTAAGQNVLVLQITQLFSTAWRADDISVIQARCEFQTLLTECVWLPETDPAGHARAGENFERLRRDGYFHYDVLGRGDVRFGSIVEENTRRPENQSSRNDSAEQGTRRRR